MQAFSDRVVLITVEAAFGDREFSVTDPNNPNHIQVRTLDEIWIKENLINLAISRLPRDWKYVAWIDGDIQFSRGDWADEAIHKLQHNHIIQLFSEAVDLSPSYTPILRHQSFCASYRYSQNPELDCLGTMTTKPDSNIDPNYGGPAIDNTYRPGLVKWHPGFAWAANREAIDMLGGLIDFALAGAADNHMAKGLIGDAEKSIHPNISEGYRKLVLQWQNKAKLLRKDIGYIDGLILHFWHGPKANRKYWERWQILVNNGYDPLIDLKRDWQGLYTLIDHGDERSIELRQGLREYFSQRNEDSIEWDPCAK